MLKLSTAEWKEFINKLEVIKTKSNREVLCIHCWQMLNCKQKIKHLKSDPEHERFLLTSTKYASEKQIVSLAKSQGKHHMRSDGAYVIIPSGPYYRQCRELSQTALNAVMENVSEGDNKIKLPIATSGIPQPWPKTGGNELPDKTNTHANMGPTTH